MCIIGYPIITGPWKLKWGCLTAPILPSKATSGITDGITQDSTVSFELRHAFADWDVIPLNPTVFAEYKIGIGDVLHDEGAPTPGKKFGPHGFDKSNPIPDGYETRLLLSDEFFHRIEWALNFFFEQEIEGDRGREWGIAQSIVTPINLFPAPAPPPPL